MAATCNREIPFPCVVQAVGDPAELIEREEPKNVCFDS